MIFYCISSQTWKQYVFLLTLENRTHTKYLTCNTHTLPELDVLINDLNFEVDANKLLAICCVTTGRSGGCCKVWHKSLWNADLTGIWCLKEIGRFNVHWHILAWISIKGILQNGSIDFIIFDWQTKKKIKYKKRTHNK